MQKIDQNPVYSKEKIAEEVSKYPLLDINKALEKDDFKYVYRPNDDSYLFIDTLTCELASVASKFRKEGGNKVKKVAELG